MGPLGGGDLRFRCPQPDTSYTARQQTRASASRGVSVYFPAEAGTHLPTPEGWKAESTYLAGSTRRWLVYPPESPSVPESSVVYFYPYEYSPMIAMMIYG